MSSLRVLQIFNPSYCRQINKLHVPQNLEANFLELRYFISHGCPIKSSLSSFYLENLVKLDMSHSKVEQLWNGCQPLVKLEEVDLSCSSLISCPDFSSSPNLKRLILQYCKYLCEISPSIQYLSKLDFLQLDGCRSLKCIPDCSGLNSLKTLHLYRCSNLEMLPKMPCNIEVLWYGHLNFESLKQLGSKKMVKGLPNIHHPNEMCESCVLIYLLNICPTKSLDSKTPQEAWSSHKPSVSHLRVFGSIAYIKVPETRRTKLEVKGEKCILVGYGDRTMGYRLYNPITKKVIFSRDVIFEENESWNWDQTKASRSAELISEEETREVAVEPQIPRDQQTPQRGSSSPQRYDAPLPIEHDFSDMMPRGTRSLEDLSICKWKSLKTLDIDGCSKLNQLPNDIGSLESLRVLHVGEDTIRDIPSSFIYLKNLTFLSLSGCKELTLSGFELFPDNLEYLIPSDSGITELPEFPDGCLSFLFKLDLSGTSLESIPASIINLSNLSDLDIRNCKRLKCLPKLQLGPGDIRANGCTSLEVHYGAQIGYPGSEIPKWFDFQSMRSFINVELPPNWFNNNFLGFAICVVVLDHPIDFEAECSDDDSDYDSSMSCKCNFKSKDGHQFVLDDYVEIFPYSNHVSMKYPILPCSLQELLCYKNEVSFEFHLDSSSRKIEKCGVHLMFGEKADGSSWVGEDEDVLSLANVNDNCEENIEGDNQLIKIT
ncbi:hypothetical protein EZV62_005917 [Acer yangbiense]|uniref:Uncharacterized protein n=1 Tax=Acer yangbiense TaxID=1000413 RepID=A0A5C7IRL9_9ROSI|nr:hypothetical protein EZV62_005917 [Acer yangbiense]